MNKNLETKLIDFEGDKLLGVRTEDGKIFLGVKKACMDIGLSENQARNEIKKIQSNLLFIRHKSAINLSVKFDTQYRETILLEEKDIPIWLAQITLTPKMQKEKPQTIEKILLYQDKCAKVLHEAFMSTEKQKQEFFNEMGLTGEIVELKGQIQQNTKELIDTKTQLNTLIDSSTINSRQAQKLLHCAKDRIGTMLGGAHSSKYKKESRMYFKNLWLSFCKEFEVSTYKDLNPLNYNDGFRFINNWSMI
ncbi:hypothetical protein G8V07_16420 [Clostridium botulinum D/C]|uniref:phage antirepressor N-terminal domain-containing protein n=3 Tax=Clostridium botulinum TaxID=1491 RepID=UPI001E444F76|nr:phage antirepressor N-terminal domain-containing protein [Clostridium botulinum]MCD3325279.1 hypothetical protein [Clostridium botulinum D/C]